LSSLGKTHLRTPTEGKLPIDSQILIGTDLMRLQLKSKLGPPTEEAQGMNSFGILLHNKTA